MNDIFSWKMHGFVITATVFGENNIPLCYKKLSDTNANFTPNFCEFFHELQADTGNKLFRKFSHCIIFWNFRVATHYYVIHNMESLIWMLRDCNSDFVYNKRYTAKRYKEIFNIYFEYNSFWFINKMVSCISIFM